MPIRSSQFSNWVLPRSFGLLSRRDQRSISMIVGIQVFLGILDLLAIIVIGLLGSLAVAGISLRPASGQVYRVLDILNIENLRIQQQVVILGLLATITLFIKTIISIFFTRKSLFFLSRRAALMSGSLISKLMTWPLQEIQKHSKQQIIYSSTSGVNAIMIGILGAGITILVDISLLFILMVGIFAIDARMAIGTLVLFMSVGFVLHKFLGVRAKSLGFELSELSVLSNQGIFEAFSTYREAIVRKRREYYVLKIKGERMNLANNQAETAFIPYIGKYVLEISVVIGILAISAFQFLTKTSAEAVSILGVFLAASTRIAPAVLRIQQGLIQVKGSIGIAKSTFNLIDLCQGLNETVEAPSGFSNNHSGFKSSIELENVSITYPGKSKPTLKHINLKLPENSLVAIVGPSGAGKTTLVDLILGVLKPDAGKVLISGMGIEDAIDRWPGAIGYVPQDIVISNGSVRENVAMGFDYYEATDERVWNAIRLSHLEDYVRTLGEGLDYYVGDEGKRLSGGQRQRLGIARALFTEPKLLVLDEATSSLDSKTEQELANTLFELKSDMTIITIAHRLSTVKNADLVLYIDGGNIEASGSFDEVRLRVPNFDRQAQIMGL